MEDLPPPPLPVDDDETDVMPPPPDSNEDMTALPPPPEHRPSMIPGPPPRASLIPGPPPRASLIPGPPPRASLIPGPPPPLQQQHRESMLPGSPPPTVDEGREAAAEEAGEEADLVSKLANLPTTPQPLSEVPQKGSVKKLSLLFSGGRKPTSPGNNGPPAPLIDLQSGNGGAAATPRTRGESSMPSSEESRGVSASVNSAKSVLPAKQENATVSVSSAMQVKATFHEVALVHSAPQANTIVCQRDVNSARGRLQNAQQEWLIIKTVNGTPVPSLEDCKRELESFGPNAVTLDVLRCDMHVLCPKCNTDFDLKAQRVFDVMSARCPACRQILSVDTKRNQ